MLPARRSTIYASCLLIGTLLVIVAALLHPDLTVGNGADHLGMIARSDAWRAIHWAFLFGFALSLTGLAGVAGGYSGTAGEGAARVGVIVVAFAYSGWMVVVTFMAGAGWTLAQTYVAAGTGMTATQAVFIYDMMRPFALAAQRIGAVALGISTYLFGWAALQARLVPRWLGWSGVGSGIVAVALALFFGEATKADQAAFAPPVVWQLVTALVLLSGRGAAPRGPSNPSSSRGPG
jgi:Domain of unknown function (DUF4386)